MGGERKEKSRKEDKIKWVAPLRPLGFPGSPEVGHVTSLPLTQGFVNTQLFPLFTQMTTQQ